MATEISNIQNYIGKYLKSVLNNSKGLRQRSISHPVNLIKSAIFKRKIV